METQEEIFTDIDSNLNFDEIAGQLQLDLDIQLSEMNTLYDEESKINNSEHLGEIIRNAVWEQFLNQVATRAGVDFIKENNGLTLDLRYESHIQTSENFGKGKIATHNTNINFQERYDIWNNKFKKDENGNIITHKNRLGNDEATLVAGERQQFDTNRPVGSVKQKTDMDHTVSAGEIIRDPAANAHLTEQEQVIFANSSANINEMDAGHNRSKGDKSMTDWLDNKNKKGQKPEEIFDISKDDDKKYRKKDTEARAEYNKRKTEGEQRTIKAGRQSLKTEALKIGGQALRSVVMRLLAELSKEIFSKLVLWFKSTKKTLRTLIDYIKSAMKSFFTKLKMHLINAGESLVQTILTAIMGPIVGTIKKAWIMIKQGAKSIKEAWDYVKKPENRKQSISILIMEVGKIILAGISATTAIVLGELIEKLLMTIPVFAIPIPVIGSLANIIGLFVGGLVAGVVGAIAINIIDKSIAKQQACEIVYRKIVQRDKIIKIQREQVELSRLTMTHSASIVSIDVCGCRDTIKSLVHDADNIINTYHQTDEESFKNIETLLINLQ